MFDDLKRKSKEKELKNMEKKIAALEKQGHLGIQIGTQLYQEIKKINPDHPILQEMKLRLGAEPNTYLDLKKEKAPKKEIPRLDMAKVKLEIKEEISKQEDELGIKFTSEQERAISASLLLRAQEDFNKEVGESEGRIKKAWKKTEAWWKNLDETTGGRNAKLAMSAAFVTAGIVGGAMLTGVAPTFLGTAQRLGIRGGVAVVINTGMAGGWFEKIGGKIKDLVGRRKDQPQAPTTYENESNVAPESDKMPEAKQSLLRKAFANKKTPYIGAALGAGASYLLSGGLLAGVGAAGFATRKVTLHVIEKKMKKYTQELEKVEQEISLEKNREINGDFEIEKFVDNLNTFEEEHTKIVKKLISLRRFKALMTGAIAIGTGISSVAVYEPRVDTDVEAVKSPEINLVPNTSELSLEDETEATPIPPSETETREEIPATPESIPTPPTDSDPTPVAPAEDVIPKAPQTGPVNPDAIVGKGEGIQHALIRQIENDPELAKELGYKGDIADQKSLHAFAGVKAHLLSIKNGYVGLDGSEVRVAIPDKIGYEIEIENGEAIIHERDASSGEIFETRNSTSGFENEPNKYEYGHEKSAEPVDPIDQTKEPFIDEYREEPIIDESPETQTAPDSAPETESGADKKIDGYINEYREEAITKRGIETNLMVTIGQHGDYTEAEWANASENIYGLSISQFFAANETFNGLKNNLLEPFTDEKARLNFEDTLVKGNADAYIGTNTSGVSKELLPVHTLVNKLHEITGLEPYSKTPLYPPETSINFIYRATSNAALSDQLGEIKNISLENYK
ncbi:MAG TPA: hypothetical protein VFQ59_01890 [Candidatus Paceibacterota bacterium]|nr:hypothetical protein [Candidatus Paceibacterota bacterium]